MWMKSLSVVGSMLGGYGEVVGVVMASQQESPFRIFPFSVHTSNPLSQYVAPLSISYLFLALPQE